MRALDPLTEWESRDERDVDLGPGDLRLAAALKEQRQQLVIDRMREGLRFGARSWVGMARFSTFEISVVPKLAGGDLGLVEMIDFTTGIDALERNPAVRDLDPSGYSLLDLLIQLFVGESDRVAREGLLRDYVEREDALGVVRGRILGDRQVLELFGRADRILCRYDEHEHDIPENQLLAFALAHAGRRATHPASRMKARRLHALFASVSDPDRLDLRSSRRGFVYHRMNEHYRGAHELSWLVLDGLGIEDVFEAGGTTSFVFMIDMNMLFERFIQEALLRLLPGGPYRVEAQKREHSIVWNEDTGRSRSSIRPDVVVTDLRSPGHQLAVDAKYKKYHEHALSAEDVYQAFLYAYAYQGDLDRAPRALLLHPADSTRVTHQLQIRTSRLGTVGGRVTAVGVSIPQLLDELKTCNLGPSSETLRTVIAEGLGHASSGT